MRLTARQLPELPHRLADPDTGQLAEPAPPCQKALGNHDPQHSHVIDCANSPESDKP